MLLLQVALYAALELWPSSVHDFQHRATGGASYAIQSETIGARAFAGFDLLHTDLTKKTALSVLNAESGMVLTKTHGVEVFVRFQDVELGIRQEKVSAAKFPVRYESWYGSTWREGDPTVGYTSGVRAFVRAKHVSVSGPLIPITSSSAYPIAILTARGGIFSAEFAGPYVAPWGRVPPSFDFAATYRGFFIRAGRIHIPLTIEYRALYRVAFGVSLKATHVP